VSSSCTFLCLCLSIPSLMSGLQFLRLQFLSKPTNNNDKIQQIYIVYLFLVITWHCWTTFLCAMYHNFSLLPEVKVGGVWLCKSSWSVFVSEINFNRSLFECLTCYDNSQYFGMFCCNFVVCIKRSKYHESWNVLVLHI
jgi:hypothetical protein